MRRAPAVAHAFAIAHAMLRLLATPKTTPVFPAKTCAVINAVTIRRINSPQSFGGTRAVVSQILGRRPRGRPSLPAKDIQLSMEWPIFLSARQTGTDRIVDHVFPFRVVILVPMQLRVPEVTLPYR